MLTYENICCQYYKYDENCLVNGLKRRFVIQIEVVTFSVVDIEM